MHRTPIMVVAARLDAWQVHGADFPAAGRVADKLEFLLRYAILAPSARNAQPWLFKVRVDMIELYADRARGLPVADPEDRQLVIGCGAALYNLRVALRRFGHAGAVSIVPRPARDDLLAEVALGRDTLPSDDELAQFDAIPRRRTNRARFDASDVPEQTLGALIAAADDEGARLEPLVGDTKVAACNLIAAADRTQHHDTRFRRELASWLVSNRSDRRDGVPGYAVGFSDFMSYLEPLRIRTFDTGASTSEHYQGLAEGSPLLAVLSTERDDARAWMSAGQALQRVLLLATAHGLSASFLNQPTEVDEVRPQLAALAGAGGFPQMVLRIGYGPATPPTPRRVLGDVLVAPAVWL